MKAILSRILGLFLVLAITTLMFSACSDDDEDTKISYTTNVVTVSYPANPASDAMSEEDEIERISSIYHLIIGVLDMPFTVYGNSAEWDKKAVESCQSAESLIDEETWTGTYTFTMTNLTSGTVIYSYTIGE